MLSVHKALPLTVLLVVASLLVANRARRSHGGERPPLDDWDVPRLVDHLRKEGLQLRVVPTHKGGVPRYNAYLTTTDKKWEEFNHMCKVSEQMARWRGSLYVERSNYPATRAEYWGDCCLAAGPFVFFGDRDLLVRVRNVLGESLP